MMLKSLAFLLVIGSVINAEKSSNEINKVFCETEAQESCFTGISKRSIQSPISEMQVGKNSKTNKFSDVFWNLLNSFTEKKTEMNTLECADKNLVIRIKSALISNADKSKCKSQEKLKNIVKDMECNDRILSTIIASKKCNGKKSCQFQVGKDFAVPCNCSDQKYLDITYDCIESNQIEKEKTKDIKKRYIRIAYPQANDGYGYENDHHGEYKGNNYGGKRKGKYGNKDKKSYRKNKYDVNKYDKKDSYDKKSYKKDKYDVNKYEKKDKYDVNKYDKKDSYDKKSYNKDKYNMSKLKGKKSGRRHRRKYRKNKDTNTNLRYDSNKYKKYKNRYDTKNRYDDKYQQNKPDRYRNKGKRFQDDYYYDDYYNDDYYYDDYYYDDYYYDDYYYDNYYYDYYPIYGGAYPIYGAAYPFPIY